MTWGGYERSIRQLYRDREAASRDNSLEEKQRNVRKGSGLSSLDGSKGSERDHI